MTSEKTADTAQRLDAHFADPAAHAPQETGWTDTGAMTNSWGKGTGYFRYRLLCPGVVQIAAKDINPTGATNTDGTTIISAANGLPSGYRPATIHRLAATTDIVRLNGAPNAGNPVSTELLVNPDGHFECYGVAGAATRFNCYGLLFTDI